VSYPYGPDGQGVPQQPDFRQPPVISSSGVPQQPYSSTPGKPSGAMAMVAAILATLGGLTGLTVAVIGGIGGNTSLRLGRPLGSLIALFSGVLMSVGCGALLLTGAVLLFRRKMIGRQLIVGGCITAVISYLLYSGGIATFQDRHLSTFGIGVAVIVVCLFPVVTLVLALLPSTTAWIRAKPDPPAPQYYPPYPG
jgi:hypothetical protein